VPHVVFISTIGGKVRRLVRAPPRLTPTGHRAEGSSSTLRFRAAASRSTISAPRVLDTSTTANTRVGRQTAAESSSPRTARSTRCRPTAPKSSH
jgi:hypothetical protein